MRGMSRRSARCFWRGAKASSASLLPASICGQVTRQKQTEAFEHGNGDLLGALAGVITYVSYMASDGWHRGGQAKIASNESKPWLDDIIYPNSH